jgi:hypothetical protein
MRNEGGRWHMLVMVSILSNRGDGCFLILYCHLVAILEKTYFRSCYLQPNKLTGNVLWNRQCAASITLPFIVQSCIGDANIQKKCQIYYWWFRFAFLDLFVEQTMSHQCTDAVDTHVIPVVLIFWWFQLSGPSSFQVFLAIWLPQSFWLSGRYCHSSHSKSIQE